LAAIKDAPPVGTAIAVIACGVIGYARLSLVAESLVGSSQAVTIADAKKTVALTPRDTRSSAS
jgi:hypothetical protein